jgi:SepF-like predicted cell division protein (DUF552 family)
MKQSKRKDEPEIRVVKITGSEDTPEARERLAAGYRLIYKAAARMRRERPDEYEALINNDDAGEIPTPSRGTRKRS